MKVEGIVWLRGVVDKLILKHNVAPYEVEEVLNSKPRVRLVEKGHIKGIYRCFLFTRKPKKRSF